MAEKIYFNSLSGKKSKYGIRLSGKVEKIIEELNKHVNDKGYINLEITERKSEGKYGETHSIKVDTWQPNTNTGVTTSTDTPVAELGKDKPFKVEDDPNEQPLPF